VSLERRSRDDTSADMECHVRWDDSSTSSDIHSPQMSSMARQRPIRHQPNNVHSAQYRHKQHCPRPTSSMEEFTRSYQCRPTASINSGRTQSTNIDRMLLWFLLKRVFIQVIMWFGVWLNYFQCQMSSGVCVPTWKCIPIALTLLPFMCYVVLCTGTSRWFDCGLLLLGTFKCFMFIHFFLFCQH